MTDGEQNQIGVILKIVQSMKGDIDHMRGIIATKDDVASIRGDMATKDDIAAIHAVMATKDDIAAIHSVMATKDDVAAIHAVMATKDDIAAIHAVMATKDDVAAMQGNIDDIREDIEFIKDSMVTNTDLDAAKSEIMGHIDGLAKRTEKFDHELAAAQSQFSRIEGRVEVLELQAGIGA